MNQYPWWKYALIIVILAVGGLYALPNVFGENPALQISANRGSKVDAALKERVAKLLADHKIKPISERIGEHGLLVRFNDTQTQLRAKDLVSQALGDKYVVALNLAPAAPPWLAKIGARPMYLGLDLRGGVYFLMEVDMQTVTKQAEERFISDIRAQLRDENIHYRDVTRDDKQPGVIVKFRDAKTKAQAESYIAGHFGNLKEMPGPSGSELDLYYQIKNKYLQDQRHLAVHQNLTTLRNRVNELGVAEPVIQQQGQDRIVVQLPGIQDTARAKEILGATATLEFHMVDTEHSVQDALSGEVPPASKLYHTRQGKPILLHRQVMLTGEYIIDASSGLDQQTGGPAVFITLDSKGARIFSRATRDNVGKPMAVVYIETKIENEHRGGKVVKVVKKNESVINVATIREQLGKRFQITGLSSTEEARNLALLLRAGALAAPISIVEERTIGPSLGRENIDQGIKSAIIGSALVLIFMFLYYGAFGLVADLALMLNLVLVVALLSLLQATLTLPGIAGIVLTIGMAVDANVLINERIREELRSGNTPQASIYAGYERAFSTIADANITTLIAALVLFGLGSGPVKGFAVTLSLGIVTSMFTAIMGTRAVINLVYGRRKRLTKISI